MRHCTTLIVDSYINDMCWRISSYSKIAVSSIYRGLLYQIEDDDKICYFDNNDLEWNEEEQCYEYVGCDSVEEIECLMVIYNLYKSPYIIVKGRKIPIISIGMVRDTVNSTIASDYDVAVNIIPRLKKAGVNCIVIGDPDKERERLNNQIDDNWLQQKGYVYDVCNKDNIEKFLNQGISNEDEKIEFQDILKAIVVEQGIRCFKSTSKHFTYFGSVRYTCNNVYGKKSNIYVWSLYY